MALFLERQKHMRARRNTLVKPFAIGMVALWLQRAAQTDNSQSTTAQHWLDKVCTEHDPVQWLILCLSTTSLLLLQCRHISNLWHQNAFRIMPHNNSHINWCCHICGVDHHCSCCPCHCKTHKQTHTRSICSDGRESSGVVGDQSIDQLIDFKWATWTFDVAVHQQGCHQIHHPTTRTGRKSQFQKGNNLHHTASLNTPLPGTHARLVVPTLWTAQHRNNPHTSLA